MSDQQYIVDSSGQRVPLRGPRTWDRNVMQGLQEVMVDTVRNAAERVNGQLGDSSAASFSGDAQQRIEAGRQAMRTTRPRRLSIIWIAAGLVLLLGGWAFMTVLAAKSTPTIGQYHAPGAAPQSANTAPPSSPAVNSGPAIPANQPAAASNPTPAETAPTSDTDRPSGLPTDPTHSGWTIVRDYAATGGPGGTGAVVISLPDPGAALGTPIHGTHAGLVKTLRGSNAYGNLIYIIGQNYTTVYAYLQSISVTDGQQVQRGDTIGTLGSSGAAGSPALNYQVWQCSGDPAASGTAARPCTNVNPADYLK